MLKAGFNKRGVALFLALAVVLVVCILADIILTIMASQNKLTNHQVNRIRAYYAAQACLNYTIEGLKGNLIPAWTANPAGGANKYACFPLPIGCIDATAPNPADYIIPNDPYITNKVQVIIYPLESGISNTVKLDAKVEYSYEYE